MIRDGKCGMASGRARTIANADLLMLWKLALSLSATDWAAIASAVAAAVVAVFTIVLACAGRRQITDTRLLQRAYLSVEPKGIEWSTNGFLVGRVAFKNVGKLPATAFVSGPHASDLLFFLPRPARTKLNTGRPFSSTVLSAEVNSWRRYSSMVLISGRPSSQRSLAKKSSDGNHSHGGLCALAGGSSSLRADCADRSHGDDPRREVWNGKWPGEDDCER
jgi:hypothetical protein